MEFMCNQWSLEQRSSCINIIQAVHSVRYILRRIYINYILIP